MNIHLIIDIDDEYQNQMHPEKISLAQINNDKNKKISSTNNEILYFKINSKDYYNSNILKLFLYHLRFCFLSQMTVLIFYNEEMNGKKELSKWISYVLSNSFFIYDEEGIMITESEILAKNVQNVSPIYFGPKFVEDILILDFEEYFSSKDDISEPYDKL